MSATIYDANGYALAPTKKLYASSNRHDRSMPWTPDFSRDLGELFTQSDWRSTLSQSRLIYTHFGVARGAMFQRANETVGKGWEPEFKGEDIEFGKAAKEWLKSWYEVCDVKGNLYDFKTSLRLDSIALDRDGDVFVILTESKSGYPQIQHVPAHRIGSRHHTGVIDRGRYKGFKISNGVVENKAGSPIAYCVLGDNVNEDEYIDVQDMVHIADAEWHNQSRGIPSLAHATTEMRKSKTSEEFEMMAQMMLSAHAIIEYNEHGGIDLDDTSTQITSNSNDENLAVKTYNGGMVKHFKSNSGSKIESISHNRPGDMWESFQDRIIRASLAGIPWPSELVWKSGDLNSALVRNIQAKARASVEQRQETLKQPALRMIRWAIAKAVKMGLLPASNDWYKWSFTMPPRLTIDPRHDSKTAIEEYKLGARNMTGMLQEAGKTHSEHIHERCQEIVERKQIKEQYEKSHGIEINDRELQMLTPNDMGSIESAEADDDDAETISVDEKQTPEENEE